MTGLASLSAVLVIAQAGGGGSGGSGGSGAGGSGGSGGGGSGAGGGGGKVEATPTPTGLPGTPVLEKLINGLLFWGLLACVVGIVIGAATWALSSHSGNYQHAGRGKMAFLTSAAGALMIGAAPALVNFFVAAGGEVK